MLKKSQSATAAVKERCCTLLEVRKYLHIIHVKWQA